MKGRDKEATKAMSVDELQARLREAQESRFRLMFPRNGARWWSRWRSATTQSTWRV